MKRLVAAVVILALVISLTIYAQITVDNKILQTQAMLSDIKTAIACEDFDAVAAGIKTAALQFDKSKGYLILFVRRDYISNVEISLKGLPAYASKENTADLSNEIDKSAAQLKMIKELY